MSIVVIGINHRTSPLELLERVTISQEALPKALHSLSVRDDVREVVVLSTCNRIEVYAITERFHAAYADIRDFSANQVVSRQTNFIRIFTVNTTKQQSHTYSKLHLVSIQQ